MGDPEFGPGGYLPDRAARRARKIILREQLGLGWPIASLLAGVFLLGVGVLYLVSRAGAPGEPYTDVGALADVDPRGLRRVDLPEAPFDALVVRAGGGVRAFAAPEDEVVYCPDSRQLEGARGSVWSLTGRHQGGPGSSLHPLPVEVHDGRVHVDPSARLPPAAPEERGATPACR